MYVSRVPLTDGLLTIVSGSFPWPWQRHRGRLGSDYWRGIFECSNLTGLWYHIASHILGLFEFTKSWKSFLCLKTRGNGGCNLQYTGTSGGRWSDCPSYEPLADCDRSCIYGMGFVCSEGMPSPFRRIISVWLAVYRLFYPWFVTIFPRTMYNKLLMDYASWFYLVFALAGQDAIVKRTAKCQFCRKQISEYCFPGFRSNFARKAQRCAFCTSWQPRSLHSN